MSIVSQRPKDCASCKLTSGFGLVGIGLYIAKQAHNWKPSLGQKVIYSLAFSVCSLGVARLFDLPPFSTSTKQEESN